MTHASDGDIYALCTNEEHWQGLSAAMGDPDWASWEICGSRTSRAENWDILQPRLAEWVAALTRDEVMQIALDSRLPFALALDPYEVQELEQELAASPRVADWLYRFTPGPAVAEAPARPRAPLQRPLDGVVALDLSTVWATPLSAAQLAHLGARVIKVEARGRLAHSRARIGELSEVDADLPDWDRKGSFRETNQGKESVTVNLGVDEGQRLFIDLARHADLVVSNFTPGVAERLGLLTEALWAANPGLVIARLSAYQPHSRLAPLTGFGYAMLLACGFGYQGEDEPWIDRSIAYPDPQTGFVLTFAMVRALLERSRSGRGALIEVDLFGPSAAIHRYFSRERPDSARGFELPVAAFSESLPCRHEEWLAVTAAAAGLERLAAVLGVEARRPGEDARAFAFRAGEASRRWEAQQLQDMLRREGIVAQRILDVRQLVREAGLVDSGLFRVPEGEHHLHAGSPWVVDGERLDSRVRARLGEHTAAVLRALLGLDADEVAALEAGEVAW